MVIFHSYVGLPEGNPIETWVSTTKRHIRLPRRARAQGHPQPRWRADLRQVECVVGAVDVHRGIHRNSCRGVVEDIGTPRTCGTLW